VVATGAGYSGTPLAKKLGIKDGGAVFAPDAPAHYPQLLDPLPDGVRFLARMSRAADLVHLFTRQRADLEKKLDALLKLAKPEIMIWVSWPKKAAKVPTDITEDVIRAVALPRGLVDVKVCAVDEIWSGLKLVIRKELRG
jgi:hypothetical protein